MSTMTTFERPYSRHKQTIEMAACQLDAYGLCFSNLNKISYETNNLISKRIIAQQVGFQKVRHPIQYDAEVS